MRRMFLAAALLGGFLLLGALVTAQETAPQPAMPQMQGMGPMMGMGMMSKEGQRGQMGQTGPGMGMMQGMMQMMDACAQMMGTTSSSSQEPKK